MHEELVDLLIIAVLCVLAAWVAWIVATAFRRTRMMKLQAELQNKLLDRFASQPDLAQYLQTDSARDFLDLASADREHPLRRALAIVEAGVVLLVLGVALLALSAKLPYEELPVLGGVVLALGIGCLLSGAVSYRLTKAWGLMPGDRNRRD